MMPPNWGRISGYAKGGINFYPLSDDLKDALRLRIPKIRVAPPPLLGTLRGSARPGIASTTMQRP